MAQLTDEQIKKEWDSADKDGNGKLDFSEVTRLLRHLNLKLKEKDVKKRFQEVDFDGNKVLDFTEFKEFLNRLRVREEIEEMFEKLSGERTHISAKELAKFLDVVQKEKVSEAEALQLIGEIETQLGDKKPTELHNTGFQNLLSSTARNSVFNPNYEKVYQDMTQPLCDYWIASSHNTYLLGDQLKGDSSVEAYKNAFAKSCRCVELDCWDGSDINEPIIYHGHTLTSKITFRSVCETVRDFGFKTTAYPVILSLEVHCSIPGQQAMARILKEVLGPLLVDQPAKTGKLLSPEQYKNKVLIKGKMVSASKQEEEFDEEEEEEEDEEESEKEATDKKDKEELKDSKGKDKEALRESKGGKKEKKKKEGVAQELSDLVTLRASPFKGFENAKGDKEWEMSSFSEIKVNKFIKTGNSSNFVGYNCRQISRIYPKGSRVNSSNYDPVPSWCHGSQIVALNYQTGSIPMWINDGKFLENGKSGYVLKPKYLRDASVAFEPEKKEDVKKTLYVQVISGWQLPKVDRKAESKKGEVIDPYVIVTISGVSADQAEFKTKIVKNNGFNPIWRAEKKFSLTKPDLAYITFSVYDYDVASSDDFIAQYSLPINSIRTGIRSIPLRDSRGNFYEKASLLGIFKYV